MSVSLVIIFDFGSSLKLAFSIAPHTVMLIREVGYNEQYLLPGISSVAYLYAFQTDRHQQCCAKSCCIGQRAIQLYDESFWQQKYLKIDYI